MTKGLKEDLFTRLNDLRMRGGFSCRRRIFLCGMVFGLFLRVLDAAPERLDIKVGGGGGGNEAAWVEGELLVRFREAPMGRLPMSQAARAVGHQRRALPMASRTAGRRIDLIRSERQTTAELMTEYAHRPDVEAVSRNYLRSLQRSWIPDDTRFDSQWGLLNTGQTVNGYTGLSGADIGATMAWPMSRVVTQALVIAIIDTGVDYLHPDLADMMWINPGEHPSSGFDETGNGYTNDVFGYDFSGLSLPANAFWRPPGPNPMDIDGHGTHMAGIAAAAANNGIGIAGVASARIMALKASPDGRSIPLADSLEAMAYAVMMKRDFGTPIAVINASFGGAGGSNSLERDMIISAGDAGIVVCAAAGNDGADNDTRLFYPAGYRLPNLVAVTASSPSDTRPAFANYGSNSVDMAAPGMNIVSTIPTWRHTQASLESESIPISSTDGLEFSGFSESLTAMVMDCGIGEPHQFPNRVLGKIALIERGGGLYFHEKVSHAMQAGAVAAIIYNHQAGTFSGTLVGPSDWIPAISLSRDEGQALLAAIALQPTIVTLSHTPNHAAAYSTLSGTSMATAFASGALTFMAYQYPEDTPAERIARLTETVDSLPAFNDRVRSGGRLNMYRAIDRDEDGLPDWWEIKWIGSVDAMDSASDSSGNNFSDWHAYRAGVDPTNPDEALRLIQATRLPDGSQRLQWSSSDQRTYRVTRADSPIGEFLPVSNPLPATPPVNTWVDWQVPTSSAVFYQVILEDTPFGR